MRHDETPNNRSRRCKVIPTDPLEEDSGHGKPPGIPVAREKERHRKAPPPERQPVKETRGSPSRGKYVRVRLEGKSCRNGTTPLPYLGMYNIKRIKSGGTVK